MQIPRIRFCTREGHELSVHAVSRPGRSRIVQYMAEGAQWGEIATLDSSIIWSLTDEVGTPLLPKMRKWFDDPNNLG